MNLADYIAFRLDTAINMLMNTPATKSECAIYLMDFKDELIKPQKTIVDIDNLPSHTRDFSRE